jgi:ribosomal protein S18 acetylase RimI-like enzyme
MSDIRMWFLPDAERLERFLATWNAWKRGGFAATQEVANDLAYLYGVEAPELVQDVADDRPEARAMERFLAAMDAYKRVGFKVTQAAVDELARVFGVRAPELEHSGNDDAPSPA